MFLLNQILLGMSDACICPNCGWEGDDKPLKYPLMFRESKVLLISKVDLLPHLRCNIEKIIIPGYEPDESIRAEPIKNGNNSGRISRPNNRGRNNSSQARNGRGRNVSAQAGRGRGQGQRSRRAA